MGGTTLKKRKKESTWTRKADLENKFERAKYFNAFKKRRPQNGV